MQKIEDLADHLDRLVKQVSYMIETITKLEKEIAEQKKALEAIYKHNLKLRRELNER